MYGKIRKEAYFELTKAEREILTILLVFADADGLADIADVAIKHRLEMDDATFQLAKKSLLSYDIFRVCTADRLERIPMYTTGRFRFVWNEKRLPQSQWAKIRKQIFERDDYTCHYCGERGKQLECDHVVPVSRGGSHDPDNLVTACKPCNQSKRDKTPEEWRQ